jgi:quaternary ammonium compound-resistance protein SugE
MEKLFLSQGWGYLYAGLAAAISMPFAKLSQGFAHMPYGVFAMLANMVASFCWIASMKHISLSTAWLVWLGMDAAIMLLYSRFMFHESFSVGKILCLVMIVGGCIGLNILEIRQK